MITQQKIPFYTNRDDNESCVLACMRSVLEFLEGNPYSWSDLERLTGFQPGKAAWTVKMWTELAKRGYDIKMIENFDYARYANEGEEYLKTFLKPEELEWQLNNSNLLEIRALIPNFLKTVHQIQKSPTLEDIHTLLADGYLVLAQLNSKVLNEKQGYSAHMILIYDEDGLDYIAHDPGLPGIESRRISKDIVYKAMGGDGNTVEVAGIRKGRHGQS